MAEGDSFAAWMLRLRDGDDAAAREVFQRYSGRLLGLARSRLESWLRHKVDPEDVVQSVYKSFFTRYDQGQFDFETWNDLWNLLTVMTLRKCLNQAEYYRAQRRDVACETAGDERHGNEIMDPEPTPHQAALLTETVTQLFRGLDADDRAIIRLSLQGFTVVEISAQLGFAERTVRRVRERVKKRLQRMHDNATSE